MTEQDNYSELKAWMEWKKWCNVFRVLMPQPTSEEIADGKEDDLSPEERQVLYNQLKKILKYNLNRINRMIGVANDESYTAKSKKQDGDKKTEKNRKKRTEDSGVILVEQDDTALTSFISCFDDYMKGRKKVINEDFAFSGGVTYKDYVFYKVSTSNDSQLRVIRGKITGPQGYIRAITQKYLKENYSATDLVAESNIDYKAPSRFVGLDAPVNTSEGADSSYTYKDIVHDDTSFKINDESETEITLKKICDRLTKIEKLLLLAVYADIAITSPELIAAADLKKTTLYVYYNDLFRSGKFINLLEEHNLLPDSDTLTKLINLIKVSLTPEKNAEAFLILVETSLQQEERKRQEQEEQEQEENQEALS